MGKPIVYVVCRIFRYDTTPFVCLLGEVRVAAKGAEALEFLFREVRVCGWHGEGGKWHSGGRYEAKAFGENSFLCMMQYL